MPVFVSERSAAHPRYDGPSVRRGPLHLVSNLLNHPLTLSYMSIRLWISLVALVACLSMQMIAPMGMSSFPRMLGAVLLAEATAVLIIFGPDLYWRTLRRRLDRRLCDRFLELQTVGDLPSRITATGTFGELIDIGELPDASFEPYLFRATAPGTWMRPPMRLIAATIVVVLAVTLAYEKPRHTAMALSVCACVLLILALPYIRRPTYYRIIPGRLDRLEFGIFGKEAICCDSIDLHTERIEINLSGEKKYIRFGRHEFGRSIDANRVHDPYRLAQAIVHGAISTAPTRHISSRRLIE